MENHVAHNIFWYQKHPQNNGEGGILGKEEWNMGRTGSHGLYSSTAFASCVAPGTEPHEY